MFDNHSKKVRKLNIDVCVLIYKFLFLYKLYNEDKDNEVFNQTFRFTRMESRLLKIIDIFNNNRIELDDYLTIHLFQTQPKNNTKIVPTLYEVSRIVEENLEQPYLINHSLSQYHLALDVMDAELFFGGNVEDEIKDGKISWAIIEETVVESKV